VAVAEERRLRAGVVIAWESELQDGDGDTWYFRNPVSFAEVLVSGRTSLV